MLSARKWKEGTGGGQTPACSKHLAAVPCLALAVAAHQYLQAFTCSHGLKSFPEWLWHWKVAWHKGRKFLFCLGKPTAVAVRPGSSTS